MTGATTATMANLLQKKYLPGIVRQFNDDFPLLKFIRQNSEDITAEGDEAIIAMEFGVNEGGGFHGESSDVEDSGYPVIETTKVSLKQMTFRARITYKLMKKARTNANAFARGAQKQMTATREGFTLRANTYLWGDGSGVVARVASEDLAGSDSIVLDRAYGLSDGGSPESLIRPGMKLHILDTKGYTGGVTNDRGQGVVKTVDFDTGTEGQIRVTFRENYTLANVAVDDYVYIGNTIEGWKDAGESQDNSPAMGMLAFYDHDLRNPLQGVNTSTQPQFKAEKISITQATVISDLRKARNRIAKRQRNGRLRYMISSYETHERYTAALDSKVEFRNVQRLDGFWEVGVFDGRPWFRDHTAPDARVFFVPDGRTIERYAVDNFINFVDDSGNPLKQVPNKTVFDAYLTAIYEYGIRRRNNLVSGVGMSW